MAFSRLAFLSILLVGVVSTTGCHLEGGKLHFDELNLNPITVYSMKPPETAIYCIADGKIPSGAVLERMHEESLAQIENNPEEADWGELVCLALADQATLKQMKETSNALVLVMATRKDMRGAARGFRKLVETKIKDREKIEREQVRNEEAELELEQVISLYEKKLGIFRDELTEKTEQIISLEKQVQKLKEVELLIQPNKVKTE